MKIDKVVITIQNIDEENASVRLSTDPTPGEDEEIEDTPAVLLGSAVWDMVTEFLESEENEGSHVAGTLQ